MLSCDKSEESAGLIIQPDNNRLSTYYVSLDKFTTYSSPSGPVTTSKNNSSVLLGSISDDVFGRTSAFFVSQYRLSSDNVDFGDNPTLISAKMFLDNGGFEGDATTDLNFKIYESKFTIADTSYSSYDTDFLSTQIGDLVADVNFLADPDSLLNTTEILLEPSFGQKILDTEYDSTLFNNDNFLLTYQGLYFTVDTNQVGPGLIWKYDFNSDLSYILLEYESTNTEGELETNTFKLQFNDECNRFNQYFNNNSPLDANWKQKDKVYISGTAGTKGHISLSPIINWRDSSNIMIYKAELILKSQASDIFSTPSALLLEIDDNDDDLDFIDDNDPNVASDNSDGKHYTDDPEYGDHYKMIMTRHIQNLINKNHNDSLLWITPYASKTNPNRVILLNAEHHDNITLKITSSKI